MHYSGFHLNILPESIRKLGFVGVDIFFVISGFIMAETTRQLPSGWRSMLQFLGSRFSRIYSGWWPFFGLYALYAWFWETLPPNISWAGSFFLWPQNLTQNLVGITWTLSFELYFYLGTAILLLSNRTRAGKVLAIFGIALLAINVVLLAQGIYRPENAGLAMSTVLVPFYLSPLALEFIAGFLLADFLHRAPNQKISHWLSGACLAFVAGYSYQYLGQLNDSGMAGFYHTVERCLLFGSFAACTVASAVLLEKKDQVPPHFLKLHALGNASYSIYLSNLLVIALCGKAYMAHQPQLQWPMGL